MKIKHLSIVLFGAFLTLTIGCSRLETVYNVSPQPIQTNKAQHTSKDVEKAIIRAGTTLGWRMLTKNPNHIIGTLQLRSHTSVVNINYDKNSYSITYKDSHLLDYVPAEEPTDVNGSTYTHNKATIHKNYNSWVRNLDNAIKTQLLIL